VRRGQRLPCRAARFLLQLGGFSKPLCTGGHALGCVSPIQKEGGSQTL